MEFFAGTTQSIQSYNNDEEPTEQITTPSDAYSESSSSSLSSAPEDSETAEDSLNPAGKKPIGRTRWSEFEVAARNPELYGLRRSGRQRREKSPDVSLFW